MRNKVISLTKVFLKDSYQRFKIFNIKDKKVETKSMLFWMMLIIVIGISFLSYKIIDVLISAGQPQIFLNIYLFILTMILLCQIILISTNILIYSKELEYVLPMPISSKELLFAKFGVFLVIVYITEIVLGFIPLCIYGVMTHISILYFIIMPIVLILYPVLLVTIISLITILLIKFSKIIKNKDIYQTIITTILLIIVVAFESIAISRIEIGNIKNIDAEEQSEYAANMYSHIGDGFLIINPAVELLSKPNEMGIIFYNLGLFILYDFIAICVFLLIGSKVYLKNILTGALSLVKGSKKALKIRNKVKNVRRAYIIKEFKQLYRNPTFFMQLIFPVVLVIISIIMIGSVIIPAFNTIIQNDEEMRQMVEQLSFNTEMVCIILGVLQFLFSISGLSLTAISREGKNAILMKYVPIDFYKQFVYKNILQVVLNTITSAVVLGIIYFLVSKISLVQILLIFITSIFISLINSYLMLIVDFKRPRLNWDSEYVLIKKNENKIFQYALMIIIILILLYIANILKDININTALIIQLIIFLFVFLVLDFLVKKFKNNLFKNII